MGANCIICEGGRTGCTVGGGIGWEGDVAIEAVIGVTGVGVCTSCC